MALPATALLCGIVRRLAIRVGFLDRPIGRSSHATPVPLGGGVAIVVVVMIWLGGFAWHGLVTRTELMVLFGGGLAVAVVGLIDDWRKLSVYTRLATHVAAATWAIVWMDGLPPMQIHDLTITFGWWGYPLGVLGIVWSLNLYNFMDGIDGLAASEGTFVGFASALVLTAGLVPQSGSVLVCLSLGAACAGFLPWNWAPARMFLGDAGSGFLGYSLACISILAARENPIAMLVFVMLGAVFLVDATVTFVRRIARHERYDVGHRTHCYQRWSRRWRSHRRVTVIVILVNLMVLMPAAILAVRHPSSAFTVMVAVLGSTVGAALSLGAGRKEEG